MYLYSTSTEVLSALRDVKTELQNSLKGKPLGYMGEVRAMGTMLACMRSLGNTDTDMIYKATQQMALLSLPILALKDNDIQEIPEKPLELHQSLKMASLWISEGIDKDELKLRLGDKLWYYCSYLILALFELSDPDEAMKLVLECLEGTGMIDLYCKGVLRGKDGDVPSDDVACNFRAVSE